MGNQHINRRRFLQGAAKMAAAGAAMSLSTSAAAQLVTIKTRKTGTTVTNATAGQPGSRTLHLYNTHTRKTITRTYWEGGQLNETAAADLDRFLGDHRCGKHCTMDRRLYDVIHNIQQEMNTSEPVHIVSAYRSPESNAQVNGAKRSYHMKGMALDIRVPGQSVKRLKNAAIKQKAGGVGYYPSQNFVHVDTANIRYW